MSTFKVEVVRLTHAEKHPNADRLSITQVFDYPVIFATESFNIGDLVAYVPVDSVMPDTPENVEAYGKHRRIKAKKLRSIFSMGMLQPVPEGVQEGDDVAELLGITKWVEPEPQGDDAETDPGFVPKYTDIENFLRHGHVFVPGEEVVITEKLHGCNARFVHDGTRLWVGSMSLFKHPERARGGQWWRAAINAGLEEKLAKYPGMVFYGEVFGWVQDLRYGHKQNEVSVRFFDICDSRTRTYLSEARLQAVLADLGLERVPVLYRGPLPTLEELKDLANQDSSLAPGQIREGLVIVPVEERQDLSLGRVKLKLISERYHLRKGGTERR